jgi:hypothetical protein
MLIRLNKAEYSSAIQQATYRQQLTSLTRMINDKKDFRRSEVDIDKMGALAEVCFAKIFDLPIILSNGIDDGTDFYLEDIGIDVKGTFYYSNVHLLFKKKESFRSDVGVLFAKTKDESVLRCCGWTTKKYFQLNSTQRENGTWQVHEDELQPIETLWRYYKTKQLTGRTIYE